MLATWLYIGNKNLASIKVHFFGIPCSPYHQKREQQIFLKHGYKSGSSFTVYGKFKAVCCLADEDKIIEYIYINQEFIIYVTPIRKRIAISSSQYSDKGECLLSLYYMCLK